MKEQETCRSFEAQWNRLMFAAGVRTQVELARVLGLAQASISDSFTHRRIPARWLLQLFEERHINPEWIRSAEGPLMRDDAPDNAKGLEFQGRAEVAMPALEESDTVIRRFLQTVPVKYLEEEISRRKQKEQ